MLSRRSIIRATTVPCISGARFLTTAPKKTVAIIGSGWAGARCLRDLNPDVCNIAVLSHRNHMVFTPLLPQTCTGTLEFRSICEPIQRVQPALALEPNAYFRTMAYDVDIENSMVKCMNVGVLGAGDSVPVAPFDFHYDFLVLAHGARPNTFNIPGVEEHAFFLREISEARGIRRRLMQNIMIAKLPTTTPEERARLLHVVVVGGGPTGVEFAGDLADFLSQDMPNIYPEAGDVFKVTLVEANEVLGTFDLALRNYGAARLRAMKVNIKKAVVAEVTEDSVVLTDGEVLRNGLVVWSTGVGPSSLNKAIKCDKTKQGRLAIDTRLRVLRNGLPLDNVFAIGDCAANAENPLPTLAAVASRQGNHLAKLINEHLKSEGKKTFSDLPEFQYKHVGSMASLGRHTALVDMKPSTGFDLTGFKAFLVWRSAYFTMLGSLRSRLYVFVNWMGSYIWGRDITYIAEINETKVWKALAQSGITRETARLKTATEASRKPSMVIKLSTVGATKTPQVAPVPPEAPSAAASPSTSAPAAASAPKPADSAKPKA